jgi:hypothetical protein
VVIWKKIGGDLLIVGGDKKGSLESETVKYGRESHGTRTRKGMRWLGAAAIVNDRPILSDERMLYKDYDRRCSIEKKNSGRESQGARRQDELIGAKTASRKVTLALTLETPRGGGFEYLHRTPASGRRRRKGNPVPGGITVPPCSWGI